MLNIQDKTETMDIQIDFKSHNEWPEVSAASQVFRHEDLCTTRWIGQCWQNPAMIW